MYLTRMLVGVSGMRTAAFAIAAVVLTLAGCSSSGSKGGCGGGCCRGGGPPGGSEAAPLSALGVSRPADAVATKYGGQKTCPVTGEELGSMGKPIAVSVKGQPVYVCCEGCVEKVRQNPDSFLAKVQAERGTR